MRPPSLPNSHLTYCLNVHPGERLADVRAAVEQHACAVRDRVAPGRQFGLGLRLGNAASLELQQAGAIEDFAEFLRRHGLYAFTINGFPYGPFHGRPVKEAVYQPDWQDPARRDYTIRLAEILARLLPEGVAGSISTVPLSYKPWITSQSQVDAMARQLAQVAHRLWRIEREQGKRICLGLECEPDCRLATTAELIEFLRGPMRQEGAGELVSLGMGRADAEEAVRRYLGACLDTSHAAVEFEDPAESAQRLRDAGVEICKVQLSAALRCEPTPAARERLKAFCDSVYLHQVKSRAAGEITSYRDLPDALEKRGLAPASSAGACPRLSDEWRIHFHVPLHWPGDAELGSTRGLLEGQFARMLRGGLCQHLEIETYTFDVLPPPLRQTALADSVVREFEWVMALLKQ